MKNGKLILNDKIHDISYDQTPSLYVEVYEDENGLKKATGKNSWLPIKLDMNLNYISDHVILIPKDSFQIFLLKNVNICEGIIKFKQCSLH